MSFAYTTFQGWMDDFDADMLRFYDVGILNGKYAEPPREVDGEQINILRRHFAPVFRKRISEKSVRLCRDANGEDIFIVGADEMPRSKMLQLAEQYRDKRGRWGK